MTFQPIFALRRITATLFFLATIATWAMADNWPQWRGPEGTSVSHETQLPSVWAEDRGVAWKCPVPEWGASVPAIWDDAILLTTHADDAKLLLLRINKQTGHVVWIQQVGHASAVRGKSPKREQQTFNYWHNLASPSPVTDGKTVVVHFGNGDLAAYDMDGQRLWKRNLQNDHGEYTIWWGHANSPVCHAGKVISVCMHDSLSDLRDKPVESYLVAHDLQSGEQIWKTPRMTGANAESCDSYTTPLLYQVGDQTQLIVMGGNHLDAYNPATGRQLWVLPGVVGGRTATGPTVGGQLVYATQGACGPLFAVRLSGTGELTEGDVVWKYTTSTPDTPCPVLFNSLLFMVNDSGIAQCLDIRNGQLKWKARLTGQYKASPMAADGRIYFLNTEGLCTVISATGELEKLAENKLDDQTIASPAVSDGRIFIRGRKALYCIGLPSR